MTSPISPGIMAPSKSDPGRRHLRQGFHQRIDMADMSSRGVSATNLPSGLRKPVAKFSPTTPPLSRIAASCQSTRLRVEGEIACTIGMGGDQWLARDGCQHREIRRREMAEVDHHAAGVAEADKVLALVGEARAGIGIGISWRKGTPVPKMFSRLQVMPMDRNPAA